MGGKSTSQGALSGDAQTNASPSFDLHSWQGLTEILKKGKDAIKDPAAYAEFRNLVLLYAQKGGDIELRKRIDAIITRFGTAKSEVVQTPSPKNEDATPAESSPASDSAQFLPKTVDTQPTTTDVKRSGGMVAPRRAQPQFSRTVPVVSMSSPPAPVLSPEPTPRASAPVSVDEPVVPTPPPVVAEVPVPVPVVVQPVSQPVLPPEPPPPMVLKSIEEHKARIATIKRAVHAHIGNPAALVGAHNNAGKKYMSALLTALKATAPGHNEGIEGAMLQLEAAYEALMHDAPQEKAQSVQSAPPVALPPEPAPLPVPEFVPPPTPVPVVHDEPLPIKAEEVIVLPVSEQKKEVPIIEKIPEEVSAVNTEISSLDVVAPEGVLEREEKKVRPDVVVHNEEVQQSLKVNVPEETQPKVDVPAPLDIQKNTVVSPVQEVSKPVIEQKSRSDAPRPVYSQTPTSMMQQAPVIKEPRDMAEKADLHESVRQAVTESRQLKYVEKKIAATPVEVLKETVGIDPTKVAVQQSELAAPEITEALHQLLHEWSIFEGSGFLGIGPGGSEHPLYIKLAPLSMGEVLAGRWDGSDPKVRKIIKEYVDAWRHEQSVAYVINETFEHYLRRVVQRILKRQRGG